MEKYGLFVGINGYARDSGLTPLKYAEADAEALATEFAMRCGFQTRTLLGSEATRDSIEQALLECGQGETFVFFFGGHGQLIRGQYTLHPVDSTAGGLKAIPLQTLSSQWHHGFGYAKVLAILDACRNELGGIRGSRGLDSGSRREIELALEGDNLVEVLYGCKEGQVSYEEEALGHGLLTKSLLDVFRTCQCELDTHVLSGMAGDLMRDWCRRQGAGKSQEAYRYYKPSYKNRIVLVSSQSGGIPPVDEEPLTGEVEVICSRAGLEIVLGDVASFSSKQGVKQRVRNVPVGSYEVRALDQGQTVWQGRVEVRYDRSSLVDIQVKTGPEPGEVWTEPVTGMEFVWVPEGWFMMGQSDKEKQDSITEVGREGYDTYFKRERPRHEVELDGFWMGRYPVRRKEFAAFVQERKYRTDAEKKGSARTYNGKKWVDTKGASWRTPGYEQGEDHPVVCVSWKDAQAMIQWLNEQSGKRFALPSEAQWEYACRAGSDSIRYWGDAIDCSRCNYGGIVSCKGKNPGRTSPVGNYPGNAWELYDMLGNVWEWCQDWFDAGFYNSPEARKRNPVCKNSSSGRRVLRGGSWGDDAGGVRCAYRSGNLPESGYYSDGFRLVCLPQDS